MRLFIAIDLPRPMKAELSGILREVKQRSTGGRFTPPDNFHITLHFIGESDDLPGAIDAMRDAVRGIRPFSLHLFGYGSFVKGNTHTAFVTVKGDLDELNILYEVLQSALFERGFSRETKRFFPHITLGRNVAYDELSHNELMALSPAASMTVTGITLFLSERVQGKMVYTPLHVERF